MKTNSTIAELQALLDAKQTEVVSLRKQRDKLDQLIVKLEGESEKKRAKPKVESHLKDGAEPTLLDAILGVVSKKTPTSVLDIKARVLDNGYKTAASDDNLYTMVGTECRKHLKRVSRGQYVKAS